MLKKALAMAGMMLLAGQAAAQSPADIAKERLQPYRELPKFVAPGPAFDAKACMAGKKVMSIPNSSANPFVKNINNAMKGVAEKVGFEFMEWQNQGQLTQWVQGVNYAVDNKFDLIDMIGGTDPKVLGPQIKRAQDAGIIAVASHYSGFEQAVPNNVETVPIDYRKAGQLIADWAIMDTQGKANALVIISSEVFSTGSMVEGIKAEFAEVCPDCKYKIQNVPVNDWSTKIQPTVQAELLRDSTINYVLPIYDSMSQFIVPAITLTGKQDSVKIATFNGTPFVIGLIQQGKVEMDIGENLDWIAHAVLDAEMRMLCGLDKIKDPKIPFFIFDKNNANTAGTPPQLSTGYGDAYVEGYNKLWKLQ
ncbi:MAG: sugar ABC transporter substrate-binding protein [Burkholderiaceae bacterium]